MLTVEKIHCGGVAGPSYAVGIVFDKCRDGFDISVYLWWLSYIFYFKRK